MTALSLLEEKWEDGVGIIEAGEDSAPGLAGEEMEAISRNKE
jgi:hypothetical protein